MGRHISSISHCKEDYQTVFILSASITPTRRNV
ncbi:hypothetical protein [Shigella phage ESh19]|nr:hypothetical protein [Shigella phage ESh19]